jgi:hypothetical protein
MRFGRLVAQEFVETRNGHSYWRCRCDCGTTTIITGNTLRQGKSQSCGCFHADLMQAEPPRLRHGHNRVGKRTRMYRIWSNMKSRCSNPNAKQYKDYGGRGIKVCKRWATFDNFLADMGECLPELQLDRIDNNGDYKPSNCRWVTPKENSATRRRK